jgi:iron complex outermembrane receptor protein
VLRLKIFILFIGLFSLTSLRGQISGDSILKTYNLNEVCVCDQTNENTQTFNFYRSNKLASIDEILARMQGVNLIKRGAYGLEPTLRNFSSGQTNLTIDGMRMYGACTDKMDPVSIYIEPLNLKAIQVTHGAAGAIEGSTIGGQIGLKLNEPLFNCHSSISGQFSQSFSSVNKGSNSSAIIQQSFKKLAYRISGTFRTASDYWAGSKVIIPYSGFQKTNTSASAIYKIDSVQQLKFDYLGDWGKNIGYPALPMDVGKATANIISLTHRIVLNPKKLFTENELKVYMNNVVHYMDDTHRKDVPMHMDMPGWSRTIGFYNNLSGKKNLKLRLDYHHANTRADMTMYPAGEQIMYMQTLPENNLNDIGLAGSRMFSFYKNQELNINGRLDYFTQSTVKGFGAQQWEAFNTDVTKVQNNFLKNLNIAYLIKIIKNSQIQVNIGYGERIPTSNERYGYYLFNRQDQFDYIGNLNLKPENSYQTELILKQTFKKFEYSANIFYNHINHYIYSYQMMGLSAMTIGAFGLKTYKNIDFAVSKGFEGSLKIEPFSNLNYLGTIKYIYAKTNTGLPLPLIAPLKIQQAIRYQIKQFQFQLEHDFAAKQSRVNRDYGDRVTPHFNLFNARVSKKFDIGKAKLQALVSCENIWDKTYCEHLDIGNIPRFGRNFTINLNYLF